MEKICVYDHDDRYVDYSSVIDEHDHRLNQKDSESNKSSRQMLTFPSQLHYILSELEKDKMDDIMSWRPHGRCFVISNPQELAEKVLKL